MRRCGHGAGSLRRRGSFAGLDENGPEPAPKDLARHGPLLVEQLMIGATRPLRAYLVGAFAEIRRGELHD